MSKPTITVTPKKKGTITVTPNVPPNIQISPQPQVPFQDVPYTAMNLDTQSQLRFRDLTA